MTDLNPVAGNAFASFIKKVRIPLAYLTLYTVVFIAIAYVSGNFKSGIAYSVVIAFPVSLALITMGFKEKHAYHQRALALLGAINAVVFVGTPWPFCFGIPIATILVVAALVGTEDV